jgi:MFS family permease
MPKKVSTWSMVVMNLYWLGLSFMWNSLHVLILPAVLLNFVPENLKNSYLGLLTFFGLILAMIIQPISGAVSDRWPSRLGRRRPLIIIGTLLDFVFLACLAWAGGIWMLFIGYIGLQITSNIAHGPTQGLMPDLVPADQLGTASGIKTSIDMVGMIVSSLLTGRLMTPTDPKATLALVVVAAILAVGAGITIIGTREQPSTAQFDRPNLRGLWKSTFNVDLKANRSFAWLIVSRLFWLSGIYGIQSFAQYFVRDRLDVPNPVQTTGDLLAAIVVSLVIFSLVSGWLCDKFGRKLVLVLAGVLGAVGSLLLMFVNTPNQLLIFGSIMGVGLGMFLSANWALANELAPIAEAGKFMGLTNLATAGAGAIGRLEGPVIDWLNNAKPGAWNGWSFMFIFGAVCIVISTVLLVKIPGHKPKLIKPEEAESNAFLPG